MTRGLDAEIKCNTFNFSQIAAIDYNARIFCTLALVKTNLPSLMQRYPPAQNQPAIAYPSNNVIRSMRNAPKPVWRTTPSKWL